MSSPKPTYCNVMKSGPWRAKLFDWLFCDVAEVSPTSRDGVIVERPKFVQDILQKLKFDVEKDIANTRNISKKHFLQELDSFKRLCTEGPCGCILVTVSSHGVIVKKNNPAEEGEVEIYEDYILTHPDPQKTEFSEDYVEELVSVKEIVEVFRDDQLKGVPKIFFIQACRYNPDAQNEKDVEIDKGVAYVTVNGRNLPKFPQIPCPPESKIAYSPPHLEDTIIVFSTPFGRVAGFHTDLGSHVWEVLRETVKEQEEPVNLLKWLRETNQILQSKEYKINNIPYKPLLSICHTLTKCVEFKKA